MSRRKLEDTLTWLIRIFLLIIVIIGLGSLAGLVHAKEPSRELLMIHGFCTNDEQGHKDRLVLQGILQAQDFPEYGKFMTHEDTRCVDVYLFGRPPLPGVIQMDLGEFRTNNSRCFKWVIVEWPGEPDKTIVTWLECKLVYPESKGT